MGLWAIFASPLLMSNDPRLISNASRAILLNPEVTFLLSSPSLMHSLSLSHTLSLGDCGIAR